MLAVNAEPLSETMVLNNPCLGTKSSANMLTTVDVVQSGAG